MKLKLGVVVFAIIEIILGYITLLAVSVSLIRGWSTKPQEVVIFVLATTVISVCLGLGVLRYSLRSYYLLLYFSSIIILSKLLIFTKIISLNGALETTIPSHLKNAISVLYHSLLIFYFTRSSVKKQFIR